MAQRSSSPASRGRGPRQSGRLATGRLQSRGGIQKRGSTPVRVDKDGDTVMGSASGSGGGRGRGLNIRGSAQTRRQGTPDSLSSRVSTRPNKTGIDTSAVQKAVSHGMGISDASSKFFRTSLRNKQAELSEGDGFELVKVWGLKQSKAISNKDGGVSDLIAFIERKATHSNSPPVKIKQSHIEGDAVILSVLQRDVAKVLRLNEYAFAGSIIKVEANHVKKAPTSPKSEIEPSQTVDTLKSVLSRRYDLQNKMLDLSNLSNDPELVRMGMFSNTTRESKFFPALMKICDSNFASAQEKEETVQSVTLAGNALTDIRSVTTLAQTFPALKNLDLSLNMIKSLSELNGWRWKFRKLEHIVLSGNPIESNEPNYKEELLRWYPSLLMLNNEAVRTTQEAQAATGQRLPLPILGPSFRDEAGIADNFVKQFFPAYDSDRSALVNNYYDPNSTFSLSVNTSAPRDDSQKVAPWDQYIKRSRNLTKIEQTSAQMSRLYTGMDNINNLFATLPPTRHPDPSFQPQKWCIECNTIPGLPDVTGQSSSGVGGLIITVHGEFSEIDVSINQPKCIRSFDRTFVLGPGSGIGGIRLATDILVLRAYGGHEAWRSQQAVTAPILAPQPTSQQLPVSIPDGFGAPAPGKADEQVQKEILAVQLSQITGMTIEYSGLCLEQSGWSLEEAVNAFEQAKVGAFF